MDQFPKCMVREQSSTVLSCMRFSFVSTYLLVDIHMCGEMHMSIQYECVYAYKSNQIYVRSIYVFVKL